MYTSFVYTYRIYKNTFDLLVLFNKIEFFNRIVVDLAPIGMLMEHDSIFFDKGQREQIE